jgi:hypothetical protein
VCVKRVKQAIAAVVTCTEFGIFIDVEKHSPLPAAQPNVK